MGDNIQGTILLKIGKYCTVRYFTSMDSRCLGRTFWISCCSSVFGEAANHSWNMSEGALEFLTACTGDRRACWKRCRNSGEACSFSQRSTTVGFDSSQDPTCSTKERWEKVASVHILNRQPPRPGSKVCKSSFLSAAVLPKLSFGSDPALF